MDKMKRIFAWAGVILLLGLYLITFILGVFGSEATKGLFMASIACTVIIPCLMYGMILMTKVLGNRSPKNIESEDPEQESKTPTHKASGKKQN